MIGWAVAAFFAGIAAGAVLLWIGERRHVADIRAMMRLGRKKATVLQAGERIVDQAADDRRAPPATTFSWNRERYISDLVGEGFSREQAERDADDAETQLLQ